MFKLTKISFHETFWRVVWPLRVDDHDLIPGSLLHSDITLTVYDGSQITHGGTIAITFPTKEKALEYPSMSQKLPAQPS